THARGPRSPLLLYFAGPAGHPTTEEPQSGRAPLSEELGRDHTARLDGTVEDVVARGRKVGPFAFQTRQREGVRAWDVAGSKLGRFAHVDQQGVIEAEQRREVHREWLVLVSHTSGPLGARP